MSQSEFCRPALLILLKKRSIYAFEFSGRRLAIGTRRDRLRANLILGLEAEPWRSTIEETLREHRRDSGHSGRDRALPGRRRRGSGAVEGGDPAAASGA